MGKIINEKILSILSLLLCCIIAFNTRFLYQLIIVGEMSLFMALVLLVPWLVILISSVRSLFNKRVRHAIKIVAFAFVLITTHNTFNFRFLPPLIIFFVGFGWLLLEIKRSYLQTERSLSSYCECGNKIDSENEICEACGKKSLPFEILSSDTETFISRNANKYLNKFQSFKNTTGAFSISWHWPAFFIPFWWLLYRKLYLWCLFYLLLVPFAFLGSPFLIFLIPVGFGMTANYIYYKSIRKTLFNAKLSSNSQNDYAAIIAAKGGIHKWVIPVAVIVTLFFVVISAICVLLQ